MYVSALKVFSTMMPRSLLSFFAANAIATAPPSERPKSSTCEERWYRESLLAQVWSQMRRAVANVQTYMIAQCSAHAMHARSHLDRYAHVLTAAYLLSLSVGRFAFRLSRTGISCMRHVVCGMLHVACCMWHVACGMLHVACCM